MAEKRRRTRQGRGIDTALHKFGLEMQEIGGILHKYGKRIKYKFWLCELLIV